MTEAVLRGQDPYVTSLALLPRGRETSPPIPTASAFSPIGLLVPRGAAGGEPTYPIVAYRVTIWACFALGLLTAYHALRRPGRDARWPPSRRRWPGPSPRCSAAAPSRPTSSPRPSSCRLITLALAAPRHAAATAPRPLALGATARRLRLLLRVLQRVPLAGRAPRPSPLAAATHGPADASRRDPDVGRELGACRCGDRPLPRSTVVAAPFLLHWALSDALPLKRGPGLLREREPGRPRGSESRGDAALRHAPRLDARLAARVRRGVGGESPSSWGCRSSPLPLVGARRARTGRAARLVVAPVRRLSSTLSLGPELKVFGTNTQRPPPLPRADGAFRPSSMARAPARLAAIGLWGLVCRPWRSG